MNKLIFDAEEVKKLFEHAKSAPDWRRTHYGAEIGRSLYLVHDEGVYLMSNGLPHLPAGEIFPEKNKVAYAQGMDPRKDSDWYETAWYMVGGDDFAEPLDLGFFEEALLRNPKKVFLLIDDEKIRIGGML